jgi:hypothetical protein
MKNIVFSLLVLFSVTVSGQKTKKQPLIEFQPDFRFGIQVTSHSGTNFFSNDMDSNIGIQSTLSLAKVKNFRLTMGYDFYQLKLKNKEALGNFSQINMKTILFMLEYEKKFNKLYSLSPTLSIGFSDLNYVNQGMILAVQHGNEIKAGAYGSISLNKTFAAFAGLHYAHYFNSNLSATQENKDYFGKSNKIVFSVGIQIH